LKDLWQLDIEATPAVCEAYRDALRNDDPRLQNLFDARDALGLQLPNIKWFVGEHAISTTLWPCS
jgi:hypothetical protein